MAADAALSKLMFKLHLTDSVVTIKFQNEFEATSPYR